MTIRRILFTLVLLGLSAQVQADERFVFRATLASAVVAHALDTSTTVDCRARGICTEANPWLLRYARPIPFTIAKTTVAALSLWATTAVYDRCESSQCRWLAMGLNVGQTVGFSLLAAHNARVGR